MLLSCEPKQASKESREAAEAIPTESPFDEPEPPAPPDPGRMQSAVTGLLVSNVSGADVAGSASRMNAAVVKEDHLEGLAIRFNQEIGESMKSALGEVVKFHNIRNRDRNPKKLIEIGFDEQYSSKDGPSATVACALLTESILADVELDSSFAVTGDMNADGTVQPVGGIDGKIRGATKGGCKHVAIPKKNCTTLSDLAILGEVGPFINIQIFSISTFEEALALARTEADRGAAIQESMAAFAEIQKVLGAPDGAKWLGNPHVDARLQKILQSTPNHESAKHLLLVGRKNAGNQLSLTGSFLQIYKAIKPVQSALEEGVIPDNTSGLSESMFKLRKVRKFLDPRTRGCADALEDFAEAMKKIGDTNLTAATSRVPKLVDEINAAWDRVALEYEAVESDPEIQEELNL